MDPAPIHGGKEAYRALLEEGLGLDVAARNARRYPVTYRDTVPAGVDAQIRLPAKTRDAPAVFTIYTGPKTAGTPQIVLGVPAQAVADVAFDVELNGSACLPLNTQLPPEVIPGENRLLPYEAPDTALAQGSNRIQVRQQPGQPKATLEWVELRLPGTAQ